MGSNHMHELFRGKNKSNSEDQPTKHHYLCTNMGDAKECDGECMELADIGCDSNAKIDFSGVKPVKLPFGHKLPLPYEPKKENRFLIKLPEYMGIESWVISDIDCPKYVVGEGWSSINITLVDPIAPSTSQKVHDIINAIEKNEGKPIPFNYTHESLGPVGDVIQKWEVKGCIIEEIDFGYDNYSSDSIKYVHMRVKPITCRLVY